MKYQLHIKVILIICIFNLQSYAQNPFDCIDALIACDNSTLEIDYANIEGSISEDIESYCDISSTIHPTFLDNNTIWIKDNFITDGEFYFTIEPEILETDIDFVLFDSPSNSCDDLESIRCMFTGTNFPETTDTICLGSTGLSPTSTDTSEEPGCGLGDDNFLASVDVNAGQVLYLAIINFSHDTSRYSVTYGGDAEISCSPVAVDELSQSEVNVFPNPARDLLHIEVTNDLKQSYTYELYNSTGTKVLTSIFSNNTTVDISNLPSGIYYSRIGTDGLRYVHKKVIKL